MKFDKFGWVVAAGLASAILVSGFDAAPPKFASVDIGKVGQDSDVAKRANDDLQKFGGARSAVLSLIKNNPGMLPDDATKYADLKTKPTLTPADQTEITRIEADALTQTNKRRELISRTNPTPDEQKQLIDFQQRGSKNGEIYQTLGQKYQTEISEKEQSMRNDVLDKVKTAIKEIATKQGYSIVFSSESAPYAANDITPEVIKNVSK